MELLEAFRGGWLRAIVVVPIVAGVIAGVIVASSQDTEFEATGIVSVRQATAELGSQETESLIDDFASALESDRVRNAMAGAEGASAPAGSIQARGEGAGAAVQVLYTADSAERVAAGVVAGVREALLVLAEDEVRLADLNLRSSQTLVEATSARLAEIEARVGARAIDAAYSRRSADLLGLRNQIANATGDDERQAALEALLDAKTAEVAELEVVLPEWEQNRLQLDRSLDQRAQAELQQTVAATTLSDLETGTVVATLQVDEVSRTPQVLRAVVAAAVVGLAVVVALAFAFSSSRRPTRRDEVEPPPPPPPPRATGQRPKPEPAAIHADWS